ncbi:hypothetical protein [Xylocopilactobacillus apis]|uniref:ABC transporter permease n=1 Tax=Xylocopilactobacillus apis TaxID=2932183 RepID=A0AAU9CNT4_9LACO|nr:hypothetical protein [Xylocopilactobacillus apis]BDR55612.1 hypothetical protein KIMC2_01740 [Xylocopilactobacillus apis]
MSSNTKLLFKIGKKKIALIVVFNFLILTFQFIDYLKAEKVVMGVFNLLVFGSVQKPFLSYVFFPLICLETLLMFSKFSLYQLQNQSKITNLMKEIAKRSLLLVMTIMASGIPASILVTLISKSEINILNELVSIALYILMQAWIFVIGYLVVLIKQVNKKNLTAIALVMLMIAINIYLVIFGQFSFGLGGLIYFKMSIKFLDLFFQIIELILFTVIVTELSKWILEAADY